MFLARRKGRVPVGKRAFRAADAGCQRIDVHAGEMASWPTRVAEERPLEKKRQHAPSQRALSTRRVGGAQQCIASSCPRSRNWCALFARSYPSSDGLDAGLRCACTGSACVDMGRILSSEEMRTASSVLHEPQREQNRAPQDSFDALRFCFGSAPASGSSLCPVLVTRKR